MEQDPQHEQQQEHKKELEQHEVQEVLGFLKRYGTLIGAGVLAAAAVILINRGCAHMKTSRQVQADQMLQMAQTTEQIAAVAEKYKSTPVGEIALLDLAKAFYNAGDYAAARDRYNEFLKNYKKSIRKPVAEIGLAFCTEADGNFAVAAEEYKAFINTYPNDQLTALAVLGMARSYEQAGNIDDARIALEDFLTDNPRSPWTRSAETALTGLNTK